MLLHGLEGSSRAAFRIAVSDEETQLEVSASGLLGPSDESVAKALENAPQWAKDLLTSPQYAQRLQNPKKQQRACVVS